MEAPLVNSPALGEKSLPILELDATVFNQEQLQAHLQAITCPQPHIALAGRSNVGKSSLLNALARRKQLARISSTPGKTRSINFFKVRPDDFLLVDLPGYGYAKRAHSERKTWGELIVNYLLDTPELCAILLLLDSRLPPQQADLDMVAFAQRHGLPLVGVLTKADKCNQHERSVRQKQWATYLRGHLPLAVSVKNNLGINALWQTIREQVAEARLELAEIQPDVARAPDQACSEPGHVFVES